MAQYIGFSTQNACMPKSTNTPTGADGGFGGTLKGIQWGKKFRLTDAQLVIQDFINALNIPIGSKVGQPGYGSTVWDFIFEPNTADVQVQLDNEIRRIAAQDQRIILNYVAAFPQENGILMEVELAVSPFNNPTTINIFFNQSNNTATLQ
jgi:phage baseplate assembly protein W